VFVKMRWWAVAAAAMFAVAGVLFAASANTAAGTNLRSDTEALKDVLARRAAVVDQRQNQLTALEDRIQSLTKEQQGTEIAKARDALAKLSSPVGLVPLTGPAVTVTMTDASPEGNEEANPDDLVIHQQDLQAVINAMWRAGAQGVQVMDQRLINTSAVRCVGNTLILQGRVYSPPFIVTGVGDQAEIERELERDDYLRGFRAAVEFFGLGYEQVRQESATLPGFEGPLGIDDASVMPDSKAQTAKKDS
jgi:uncharacterized protein YlxW (UPF0749 family)